MEKIRKIALLGQPNSGKSTLFNTLTGMHQHVGNWPGKTVEKKEGTFIHNGIEYLVADLPGSYSLSANSDEEIVTRDYIASGGADVVCILADASQLERSLFMLADYVGIQTPAVLVLNMIDVAKQQGKTINTERLSSILGIPVVALVAPDKKNYDCFYSTLQQAFQNPKSIDSKALFSLFETREEKALFSKAMELIDKNGMDQYSAQWLACKLLEGDKVVAAKISAGGNRAAVQGYLEGIEHGSIYTSDCKFQWIGQLISETVSKPKTKPQILTKFDRVAISKKWGKLVAIGIILLGLVGSMVIAAPIMGVATVIPNLLKPDLKSFLKQ